MCVLCKLEILHDGTGSHYSVVEMIHAETFQRLCAEVLEEFLSRRLLGEDPVVELKGTELSAEIALKVGLAGTVEKHLLWLKVAKKLLHIVVGALTGKELSGGDVQETDATRAFSKVDGGKEIVLLVVEHIVAHGHSRRDEFRYAALHHLILG